MAYQVVITDPEKAYQAEVRRQVDANLAAHRIEPADPLAARVRRVIEARVHRRPAGTVHAVVSTLDCPEGRPNCRNCGDPEHAAACRAAGHCRLCGQPGRQAHGVAFQRYLDESGYALVEHPD